jgi:thiol-disulfide isomerase/thioredoxin
LYLRKYKDFGFVSFAHKVGVTHKFLKRILCLMKTAMKWKIAAIVVAVIVIALVARSISGLFVVPSNGTNYLDDFAKCLTSKGVTMYGAEWCGHCKNQKELFGDSFKYINYVECPNNQDLCKAMGITGYPTWVVNDNLNPGEQTLETLSSLSGCPLK